MITILRVLITWVSTMVVMIAINSQFISDSTTRKDRLKSFKTLNLEKTTTSQPWNQGAQTRRLCSRENGIVAEIPTDL